MDTAALREMDTPRSKVAFREMDTAALSKSPRGWGVVWVSPQLY